LERSHPLTLFNAPRGATRHPARLCALRRAQSRGVSISMSAPVRPQPAKGPSKVEAIKAASNGLLGTLAEEMAAPTDKIGDEASQLIKFHGVYQQDDRDQRAERRR